MTKNISIELPQKAIEVLAEILRPSIALAVRQSISEHFETLGHLPEWSTPPDSQSSWMGVNEAAAYMRCHPKTVLKMLANEQAKPGSGLMGHQKTVPNGVWRIHRDDVDAWIRGDRSEKSPRQQRRR